VKQALRLVETVELRALDGAKVEVELTPRNGT